MKFLRENRGSILAILATLVIGALVVGFWVYKRMEVTDAEIERARTNCVEWVVTYDVGIDTARAITICQTAENADAQTFYFRWVPGQYGKIDPPADEDIPGAITGKWYPESETYTGLSGGAD